MGSGSASAGTNFDAERILLIEDDADIREMIGEMLRAEGYVVVGARDAVTGLAALRQQRFTLVLTDQRMPGRTGAAMLREAQQAGLLADAAVLVLTASAEDPELAGFRVLRKPIDFDVLLDEVHQATVSVLDRPRPTPPRRAGGSAPAIELVLYVTRQSPASQRAQRNLERMLARHDRDRVALTVVDLSQPGAVVDPADRVVFTPTLVRRAPLPRVWLLGDLRDLKVLRQILDDAGVPRKPA